MLGWWLSAGLWNSKGQEHPVCVCGLIPLSFFHSDLSSLTKQEAAPCQVSSAALGEEGSQPRSPDPWQMEEASLWGTTVLCEIPGCFSLPPLPHFAIPSSHKCFLTREEVSVGEEQDEGRDGNIGRGVLPGSRISSPSDIHPAGAAAPARTQHRDQEVQKELRLASKLRVLCRHECQLI